MKFGRKFAVLGGAGFIGSNLVRCLCDLGKEVIVIDDLSSGYETLVDARSKFYQCSMRDIGGLRPVLEGTDTVFILAARSIIKTSFTNPLAYIDTNINELGMALLECIRAGISHIVFSSSAAVYGSYDGEIITEDAVKMPITVYGATKSAAEEMLAGMYGAYGLNSVALRYFNVYGPNDLQYPVTRAVPAWIRAGIAGMPVMLFWGGKQVRDYVYVEDIANAHLACVGLDGHHRFNVGSGTGIVMRELLGHIEHALGVRLEVVDSGSRVGDPMKLVASRDRIMARTGWRPKWSIEAGIAKTVEYYRQALQ